MEAAALASNLPGVGWMDFTCELEKVPLADGGQLPGVGVLVASRDYFRVMQVSPRRGRRFNESDEVNGATTAIVNESFAAKFWPGEDPLAKRLRLVNGRTPQPWLTVVGVIPDIHQSWDNWLERDPLIYVPYAL